MNLTVGSVLLRRPEPGDVEALYAFKNDPEVATLLGGYSRGYARSDLQAWVEHHRNRSDEVLWTIADLKEGHCLGHVGLYKIDHRVGQAEFAIMLGDKTRWGKGVGKDVTREVVKYGFDWLNLNRIELSVLASNNRAIHIYSALGFVVEGLRRKAQYKDGEYLDVQLMAILRDEFKS